MGELKPRVTVTKKSHPPLGVILHTEDYDKPTPKAKVNDTRRTIPTFPAKVATNTQKGL